MWRVAHRGRPVQVAQVTTSLVESAHHEVPMSELLGGNYTERRFKIERRTEHAGKRVPQEPRGGVAGASGEIGICAEPLGRCILFATNGNRKKTTMLQSETLQLIRLLATDYRRESAS